jgi:hypothetical protein
MIIDLSKPRSEYFQSPDATQIMRQFVGENSRKKIETLLRQLNEERKLVTGTKEGDLEQLLSWQDFSIDSLALVRKIEDLEPDQLLVLPPSYHIPTQQARQTLVYDLDSLVKLDSMAVKRKLLSEFPKGRLSAKRKQAEQWDPEKVIRAAFDHLHENKEQFAERTFAAYSWFGKDGHRRVVSLHRAIQGAELRAFQNLAAYRLVIPVMRKELKLGKTAESSYREDLSPQQTDRRKGKITRYENYLRRMRTEGQPIGNYVKRLDVDFSDLIDTVSRPFAHHGGRLMHVPSRSRPEISYNVKLTGIPLLPPGDPIAYSQVWELRGKCVCEDKTYRSDRRRTEVHLGQDEDFFCPHEIAALHTLRKIYEQDDRETIPFLPFVIPTAEGMDHLEKLRNQTVVLVRNESTGRFSKRALNHAELEDQIWKKGIADGYDRSFTTDPKGKKYDPMNSLVTFT